MWIIDNFTVTEEGMCSFWTWMWHILEEECDRIILGILWDQYHSMNIRSWIFWLQTRNGSKTISRLRNWSTLAMWNLTVTWRNQSWGHVKYQWHGESSHGGMWNVSDLERKGACEISVTWREQSWRVKCHSDFERAVTEESQTHFNLTAILNIFLISSRKKNVSHKAADLLNSV